MTSKEVEKRYDKILDLLAEDDWSDFNKEGVYMALSGLARRSGWHYLGAACDLAFQGALKNSPVKYERDADLTAGLLSTNLHLNNALFMDTTEEDYIGLEGTWRLPARSKRSGEIYWVDAKYIVDAVRSVGAEASPNSTRSVVKKRARSIFRNLDNELKSGVEDRLLRHSRANHLSRWMRTAQESTAPAVRIRLHYGRTFMSGTVHVSGGPLVHRVWLPLGETHFTRFTKQRRSFGYHYLPRIISFIVYKTLMSMSRPERAEEVFDHLSASYQWMLSPLLSHSTVRKAIDKFSDRPTLVITTHGALAQFPFGALHDGEQYLADRFNLVQTACLNTSADLVLDTESITGGLPPAALGELRVLADPELPGISEELEAYDTHRAGFSRTEIRTSLDDWVKQSVRWLVEGDGVSLLSSHFKNSPYEPTKTFIAGPEGRRIYLLDSIAENSSLPLLVLAGCTSTAPTDWLMGDRTSVIGSLRESGVEALVTTLWEIHVVSASTYNGALVAGIAAGLNRAQAHGEAVRKVKASMPLDDGGHRRRAADHPYYWAPFILNGAWS